MSSYDDNYEDQDNDSQLVKDLRKQLRDKAKALNELQTKVENFETQSRASSIADVLKAKGLPEKVARLLPKDVEATEEGVGKWLEEYGDVFGVAPAEQAAQAQQEVASTGADQEAIAALARAQATGHAASAPDLGAAARLGKVEGLVKEAKSMDELVAGLNNALLSRQG